MNNNLAYQYQEDRRGELIGGKSFSMSPFIRRRRKGRTRRRTARCPDAEARRT